MRRAGALHLGSPRRRLVLGLAVGLAVATALVVARAGTWSLMLPQGVLQDQQAGGTWKHMFDLDGLAAAIPLPLWVIALAALTPLGFPYVWLIARALPDRGFAVSRIVGLLLVSSIVWWIASLRLLTFSVGAIWLSVAIVAAGALAIFIRNRSEIATWLRSHWKLLLVEEGLFWALFLLALYVRWVNPDLWHPFRGGEKPMDLAYLTAVAKSSSFPPFDPWFAGGAMNYYYYGFVQFAALAKITGIPPSTAYNLAIPTLVAMFGTASFGAALGLAPRIVVGRVRLATAALAAVFATVAGNLGELRVVNAALRHAVPNDWWYWNASRAIDAPLGEPTPITEFPAFTFIYGDLHAHAMALPLAALVLVLAVAYVRDGRGLGSNVGLIAAIGLVLGAVWVTNTWDLPTYALVTGCALALGAARTSRSWRSLVGPCIAFLAILGGAYLSFLPFHLHSESVFEGVQRWHGPRTELVDYATVHGVFLFAIVSSLLAQLVVARDLGSPARALRLDVRHLRRRERSRELRRALVRPRPGHIVALAAAAFGLGGAILLAVLGHRPAAVATCVALLCALAWPVARRPGDDAGDRGLRRLGLVFVLVGLLLTVAVEYVVVRNIDVGRTNTVFKLYLQVWVLWSLAAAVSVGSVWSLRRSIPRILARIWLVMIVVLVASALLYPVLATRAKARERFDPAAGRSLDGMAFMRTGVLHDRGVAMPLAGDRAAVIWMLEHVDGSPVVAEVNTAPTLYGWELRYAMFTGNPAIVGWDYHQRQQRPSQAAEVTRRVAEVQEMYATDDERQAHDTLVHYGASYVVVGPLERAYYPQGTAKWERGVDRYWTLAYSNPNVRIYRVIGSPIR